MFYLLIVEGGLEEVVKKNYVKRGLLKLLKKEVRLIVVIGIFGNFVFIIFCCILEVFKIIENWEFWECRYIDILNIVVENIILFVYGWFGMWNDDLCLVGRVEMVCKFLKWILEKINNVKVIVGIRFDFYKKYYKYLMILFCYKIYLDIINCEYLKVFLKNI